MPTYQAESYGLGERPIPLVLKVYLVGMALTACYATYRAHRRQPTDGWFVALVFGTAGGIFWPVAVPYFVLKGVWNRIRRGRAAR